MCIKGGFSLKVPPPPPPPPICCVLIVLVICLIYGSVPSRPAVFLKGAPIKAYCHNPLLLEVGLRL